VAPWLRGYAPTALAPDGNYQTGAVAQDAIALTEALAGDREAVLIGHDWGAIAAYNAAGARPELFRRLVTMAVPHSSAIAAHFVTNPEQLQRSWYIFLFQTPLAEIAVPYDDYALIDLLWRDWSPGHVPDPAFMRALKDTLGSPGSTEAAIGYYRSMLGDAPTDPGYDGVQAAGAGPIDVPTLYLHGADDGCMGIEMVVESELTPFFPKGLRVEVVASSGHFLHLDQPEAVNQLVMSFLS